MCALTTSSYFSTRNLKVDPPSSMEDRGCMQKIACSTNVIESLWEKREKNILPTSLLEKKILDDQKSPTPPSPSRVKWSAPKVNQHATIHLYTRYLACLHQTLCLSPALLLQMDLKLHLKMTKIYKILAVQACK